MTEHEELLKQVFEIFIPPFKYNSRIQTVTDSKGNMIFNVRGWGHIQKFKDAEKIQDTYGAYFADLINRDWQAATVQAVPEGFVVVPVEPTGAMVKAGSWNDHAHSLPDNHVIEIYKAMIAVIAEMRELSFTGSGAVLNVGDNGLRVAAFDAMQAQLEADKWISVEDRLPEMYTRVLVKADSSYVAGREPKSANNEDWGISGDWMWGIANDLWCDSHMVTHWQPLPEPPKPPSKTFWAVNIPEEPESEELLFAATSKEHAQSIVSRLHNEIFETYPTLGEPIANSIYVTEWQDSAEEHAESLSTKWWEHTTFLGCE